MKLTETEYEVIETVFPIPRRKATLSNLEILNAILYVLENGCKWRCLPKEYGKWNTIYVRVRRWSKKGILQKAFLLLQEKGIIQVNGADHLDRFYLHQSASRCRRRGKKHGQQSIGRTRGGYNTKLHVVSASDRDVISFALSSGEAGDGPEGRKLIASLGHTSREVYLLMDKAYEGDETRALVSSMGYIPVVPPMYRDIL